MPNGIYVRDMGTIGNRNVDGELDQHVVDAHLNVANRFFADIATQDNSTIPTNSVQATFKVANWGSQLYNSPVIPWVTTQPVTPLKPAVNHPMVGYPESTSTHSVQNCKPNDATTVCGAPKPPYDYQCVMVELAQAMGAPDVKISTPVSFRNMRFVGLSDQRLKAEINTKGVTAKSGRNLLFRDVVIDIITRNMPAHGNSLVFLDSWLMNQLKQAFLGVIQALNPFGLSLSLADQMKVVWPTYETHVYYEEGHSVRGIDGRMYRVVRPMNSFGYFFSHDGLLFGYNHSARGIEGSALTPTGRNGKKSYMARVQSEQSIKLESYMIAEEIPSLAVDLGTRICRVFNIPCCVAE